MKRTLACLLLTALAVLLAACAVPADTGPGADSSGAVRSDGVDSAADAPETPPEPVVLRELSVCLGPEPDTLDPALNFSGDGSTLIGHLFSGLARWSRNADGRPEVVPDAAEALPEGVVNSDGTVTYTYTLREGMQWSDGTPVAAEDFVYGWQRAASTELDAYYRYLFEPVAGYDTMWETASDGSFANPDARLAVTAPDDRTLSVTLTAPTPGWNERLALPAFFPVRYDAASNEYWAENPKTLLGNGPYTISEWEHGHGMTLVKNPSYWDADAVELDTLAFHFSDAPAEALEQYRDGAWQVLGDLPVDLDASLEDQLVTAGQMGTYYLCWNANQEVLPASSTLTGGEAETARAEIRTAIGLVIDRARIAQEAGAQVPAASLVPLGMTNPDGTPFCVTADASGEPAPPASDGAAPPAAAGSDGTASDGTASDDTASDAVEYDETRNAAMETLRKYYAYDEETQSFSDFPLLTYLYNEGAGHQAVAEDLQSDLYAAGLPLNLESRDMGPFLRARRDGNFSLVRDALLADYPDPLCFLEQWTSDSPTNYAQLGRGPHMGAAVYHMDLTPYGYDVQLENSTWAETYDVLIDAVRGCRDETIRYALLHEAETLLLSTGCIVPLYFYADRFLVSEAVRGFDTSPLGYPDFRACTVLAES